MHRLLQSLVTLSTLLLLSAGLFAQEQPCYTYRLIDIKNPSGETQQTSLRAINHAGVIAGQYTDPDTMGHNPFPDIPEHGFQLVRQGKTKLLVTPMPPITTPPVTELHLIVQAINDQRDTAGTAHVGEDSPNPPGMRGEFGYVRRHLKVPTIRFIQVPGSEYTSVHGINNKRDVVGSFSRYDAATETWTGHGFWLYRGTYIQIDAPFSGVAYTVLTGINAAQRIIGWYADAEGRKHGLDIIGGVYATLDVPGAYSTVLNGLNDEEGIVGVYQLGHPDTGMITKGFVYQDGAFFDIDPGPMLGPDVRYYRSLPSGINNRGKIVGTVDDDGGFQLGFIATPAKCPKAVAQR